MAEGSEAAERHAVHDSAPAYRAATVDGAPDDAPEGYKRTEVGVIPEKWRVRSLDSVGGDPAVKAGPFGSSLIKSSYSQTGFKVYGQEQVLRGDHLFGDYFISKEKYRQLRSCSVKPGDVLISLVGTAGKALLIPEDAAEGIINPRLVRVRLDESQIEPRFFKYLIESEKIQTALSGGAQGGTMDVLNAGILRALRLPIPPLLEQRAIATALSDADALIDSLDRLIAKKRAIKQAAMQQLLTGQTRLPGFTGEWETKMLGEIAELHRRGVNPAAFPDMFFRHFSLPAFDENREPTIDLGANIGSNKFRVPQEAVLVSKLNPRIPRIWKPRSIGANAIASTEFLLLTPREGISRDFLHVVCSSTRFSEQMELSVTGTTGSHQRISPTSALKFEIMLPPSAKEQTAITTVLSDMDTEIEALECRHDKARQIKRGMMQQLLTGRVRLIEANREGASYG